jgi:hypothetical protein
MKYFKKISAASLILFSAIAFGADNTGKVTGLSLASTAEGTLRAGTVQFSIEGGLSTASCDQTYTAILKEDTHLISLLLMAKSQNRPVRVYLDVNNKYYQDRCMVNYLEMD